MGHLPATEIAPDAATAQAEATSIRKRAIEHKRLASHHRRQAQDEMERLKAFRKKMAAFGIEVVIEDPPTAGESAVDQSKPTETEGGQSHGSNEGRTTAGHTGA